MSGKTLKLIPLIAKRDQGVASFKEAIAERGIHPGEPIVAGKVAAAALGWRPARLRAAMRSHIIFSGRLMAQTVDDDAANRAMGGLLGFQLYVGPPMKLELRNIWLKNL
jgi:DNA-binding GntR family transcriptional regulator